MLRGHDGNKVAHIKKLRLARGFIVDSSLAQSKRYAKHSGIHVTSSTSTDVMDLSIDNHAAEQGPDIYLRRGFYRGLSGVQLIKPKLDGARRLAMRVQGREHDNGHGSLVVAR